MADKYLSTHPLVLTVKLDSERTWIEADGGNIKLQLSMTAISESEIRRLADIQEIAFDSAEIDGEKLLFNYSLDNGQFRQILAFIDALHENIRA